MVKNLLIARKTYRFRETVGMFIVKKYIYIFERQVSSGSYQVVNARKFLKGGMEKRGGIYIYIYIYSVCVCVCVCVC